MKAPKAMAQMAPRPPMSQKVARKLLARVGTIKAILFSLASLEVIRTLIYE